MFLECIDSGLLSSNCYIIGDSGEAALIDAGAGTQSIGEVLDREKLVLKFIILTHAHVDHIISLDKLRQIYNPKVLVHPDDAGALNDPVRNGSSLFRFELAFGQADGYARHGDLIKIGGTTLEIIHTPGHTPGSITIKAGNMVFTGDTLFKLGVGRTDLPGGSGKALMESISNKLLTLDDATEVYPGHGPSSTIGYERRHNPYI